MTVYQQVGFTLLDKVKLVWAMAVASALTISKIMERYLKHFTEYSMLTDMKTNGKLFLVREGERVGEVETFFSFGTLKRGLTLGFETVGMGSVVDKAQDLSNKGKSAIRRAKTVVDETTQNVKEAKQKA